MPNDGERKKSRKKTSSKRIADAVEQARQASQGAAQSESTKPQAQDEFPPPAAAEPEPIVEVRETTTVVEEIETAHADALPLLDNEPLAEMAEEQGAGVSLSERAACLLGDVQRLAAEYIDASEEYAQRLLEIQSEAASIAEGTPLERVLRAQCSLGHRIVESSARAARALWRVDRAEEARG
jgi:hypothetical protein